METQDPVRAVEEKIRSVLADPSLRGARLAEAIHGLGARPHDEPFRLALRTVLPLDLSEDQARATLDAIEAHRAGLEANLGRDPGFSVAALDYLQDQEGTLRDPLFNQAPPEGPAAARRAAIPNEASIEEIVGLELKRAERFARPAALVLLAPDGAPQEGERAMLAAAAALRDGARDTDQVARLASAGFAVILPCTAREAALLAARRLRGALLRPTGVTWSAGVAAAPGDGRTATALERCARVALEAARVRGGDRAEAHHAERREHPRRAASGLAGRLRREGTETAAAIEDLSLGGALIRTAERLEPGSECTLVLRETTARPREISAPLRVVRAAESPRTAGGAGWVAAVVFLSDAAGRVRLAGLLADLPERPRDSSWAGGAA